jgi:hypothetical protein
MLRSFLKRRRAAALVEYAILLVGLILVSLGVLVATGEQVNRTFQAIRDPIAGSGGGGGGGGTPTPTPGGPQWITPAGDIGQATGGTVFGPLALQASGTGLVFSARPGTDGWFLLSGTGQLSGTAPFGTTGSAVVVARITDVLGRFQDRSFTVRLGNPPLWGADPAPGVLPVGAPIDLDDVAADPDGTAVVHELASGALPAGVTYDADGRLSRTPTATGTFAYVLRARDADGMTAVVSRSLRFGAPPLWPTASDVVRGVDDPLTFDWTALDPDGGTVDHLVLSGTLPAGVTYDAAGQVTGIPTETGTFTLTLRATDAEGHLTANSIHL